MKRIKLDVDKILLINEFDPKVSSDLEMYITKKFKVKNENIIGYTFSNNFEVVPGVVSNFDDKVFGFIVKTPIDDFREVYLKFLERNVGRIDIVENILFTNKFKTGEKVFFKKLIV